MIFGNSVKSDDKMWIEIRDFYIFFERKLKDEFTESKSLNLVQDSQRNHQMNKRDIFEK